MSSLNFPVWLMVALATWILSMLVTRASILYAKRRQMFDLPGRRRSHEHPTPRGGGMGIVLSVIAALVCMSRFGGSGVDSLASFGLFASIVVVALVGWIDDHHGLHASIRFLAHCLAALLLGLPGIALLLPDFFQNSAWLLILMAIAVAGVSVVWSINLHNFMDGINGLLSMQAIFVFTALALVCAKTGYLAEAQIIGLFAIAVLGFLPFNFPRARVFMGDVGSGVLGLLVAVAVGLQIAAMPAALAFGIIACSAFLVDSTATLLSRVFSGRRWYSAHREHLYQWLVRSNFSHVQVTSVYMLWNVIIVAPTLVWLCRSDKIEASEGAVAATWIYALAVLVWVAGKRYCLNRAIAELRLRRT